MRALGDALSVTVVGAEYPVNLGYIARLLQNFGVRRLYLVDPKVDMRAASVYASHGAGVLANAEITTLAKVRKAHDALLATTAVRARRGSNVGRAAVKPEEAVRRIMSARSTSMVFGRDTTGLTNEELSLCDLVTTVETGTEYRTLNVSHAAAILLFLASRARPPESAPLVASKEKRAAFSRQAYQLAVASGVQGHRVDQIVQVARRVAFKSNANSRELGLLISLMRKAEFALSHPKRVSASPARRGPA